MFSSKSALNRRAPESKANNEGKERDREKGRSRRGTVSSSDLRITFENVMHSVSMYQGDVVSKDSVVKCVESIYNWIVFDPDIQLDLPTVPGSHPVLKMWPHGATIDTRKKTEGNSAEKSSRRLRQLDEEAIFSIANSVISSTFEEERPVKPRGEVVSDAPKGEARGQQLHTRLGSSSLADRTGGRFARVVPEALQPAPVLARRIVPRYSVLEGTAPVAREQETPDPSYAETHTPKRGRKPRVGAARRGPQEDGVEVCFVD